MAEPPAVRASDAERDRAVATLQATMVEGRLTLEEYSGRLDAAYAARTREELDELLRDLPTTAALPERRRPASRWTVAVMGGATKRGRWRIEGRTRAVAVMGGCHLDLRRAELAGSEVTIEAYAIMGGIEIVVPENVEVELSGIAIMGGKDHRPGRREPPPGAPVVRVRALAVMGGVSVKTKATPPEERLTRP
jgi:hypothetical protein